MRVYLREVGSQLEQGERTFLESGPIDLERAREQHRALQAGLEELGLEVTCLPALEGFPDAPFLEDVALLLGETAVLTRPGADSRKGEVSALRDVLGGSYELLEMPDRIAGTQGATLDGGDVLRIDDVLYVGQSTRTNHAGLKSLAHAVLTEGLRVKAVEVDGCLHLKTGACNLGDDRVLLNPAWVDLHRMGEVERVEVDPAETMGANVLRIGPRVLASSSYPRTNEKLRSLGYEVLEFELSELHKAEAGITCLVLCDPFGA